jgi:hypothetical protein
MKFFKLLFFGCLIIFLNINLLSQEVEEEPNSEENKLWDDDFDMKFTVSHPSIEIKYGMGNPSFHKDIFQSSFKPINSVEARLGFIKKETELTNDGLFDFKFNYLCFQNMTSSWNKTTNDNSTKINTDAWQFGIGNQSGYGYKLGEKSDLTLYHTGALVWTQIDFMDTTNIPKDQKRMDNFGDNFRFGNYFEAGINFQIYEPVAITLGYQETVIFPRHMFWKWAGSGIIEGIGSGAISWFTGKVIKSSPKWGPVVYFVLKNAYSYGINELRKKKMNWPFNTDAPLIYDNYKIGLSFAF